MKKTLLIILFFNCILVNSNCQDLIYKNDGTEIKAKVVEITDENIKYKNFNQLEGPLRYLSVNEVFLIIYHDGTKEVFMGKRPELNESKHPVQVKTTDELPHQGQVNNTIKSDVNQLNNKNSSLNIKKYKTFNWGIQGGLNFPRWSKNSGEDINDYMPGKMGYFMGVFSKISFNDFLSLQIESFFVSNRFDVNGHYGTHMTGGIINNYSYDSYCDGVMTLNYLQFPILLKGVFKNSSKIKPSLFFGPLLNVKLSAKAKGSWYDTNGNSGDIDEDFSDEFNSIFVGLTSGLGCVFYFFSIEARYDFGLTDIGGSVKLNSAKVAIGFYF